MCQNVGKMNRQVFPRCSLHRLFPDELDANNASDIIKRAHFYYSVTANLGNSFLLPPEETAITLNGRPIYGDYEHSLHTSYEDEIEFLSTGPKSDMIDAAGMYVNQQSVTDFLINYALSLPQGEKFSMFKVICSTVNKLGKLIGTYDENPNY